MIPPQDRPPHTGSEQAFGFDEPARIPAPVRRLLCELGPWLYAAAILAAAFGAALPFLV